MNHRKEVERITDQTIILPDYNIREIKRQLKEYNEELEKYRIDMV